MYFQLLTFLKFFALTQGAQQILAGNLDLGKEKIAIIGAGAGGLSLAYYLQKYTSNQYDITIFDKNDYVGGRAATVYAYDDPRFPFELGATVIVKRNEILVTAAEEFGLELHDSRHFNKNASKIISISQGNEIVFSFDTSKLPYVHAAWRYGLSPIKLVIAVRNFIDQLVHFYYDACFPFTGLTEVGEASGFNEITGQSGILFLINKGISALYSTEVAQALLRFHQGLNLDETHGVTSLIGNSVQGLLKVEGGIQQIFEKFVKASNAVSKLNTTVTEIEKSGTQWTVTYSNQDENQEVETFDKIILAAPYFQSGIGGTSLPIPNVEYSKVVVTFFAANSRLNRNYFNVSQEHHLPGAILTTVLLNSNGSTPEDTDFPFTSLSVMDFLPETGDFIYRMVSKEEVDRKVLEEVVEPNAIISWTSTKDWVVGYPTAVPIEEFVDFQVGENIWYLNTMEQFASTMETASLAGANVAALISVGKNTTALVVP